MSHLEKAGNIASGVTIVAGLAALVTALFPATNATVSMAKKRSISYSLQAISTATRKEIEGVEIKSPESNPLVQGIGSIDSFVDPSETPKGYKFVGWFDQNGNQVTSLSYNYWWDYDRADLILTAYFEPIVYTVTFTSQKLNGGRAEVTLPTDFNYTVEDENIPLNNAEVKGYKFQGWHEEGSVDVLKEIDTSSCRDYSLVASWSSAITYTITYSSPSVDTNVSNVDYGSNRCSYTVEDSFEIDPPSAKGYAFLGWFDEKSNALPSSVPLGSTGDKNYVAKFAPITYTLTFDPAGGDVSATKRTYTIEDEAISYPTSSDVNRLGYTFAGWVDEDGNIVSGQDAGSTGNKTLTAKWTLNSYDIHYSQAGIGYAPSLDDLHFDNPLSYTAEDSFELNSPSVEGYNFVGWFDENDNMLSSSIELGSTGEKNYVAKFEPITYTLIFDPGLGSVSTPKRTYTIEDGAISYPASPDVSRLGCTFTGWADEDGNIVSGQDVGSTGDKTMTAKWNVLTYAISYSSPSVEEKGISSVDYGANPDTYTVEDGRIDLDEPSANGYRFLGWKLNGATLTNGCIPAGTIGNLNIEALWEPISYSVSYQLNGGANSKSNLSSYNIENGVVALSNPTRKNYVFKGWRDASGNIVTTLDGYSGKNMILTAIWGLPGSGTTTDPYQIYEQEQLAMISEDNDASYILMSDITLTGSWNAISSFSGSLDGNGHTITYGSDLVAPSNGKLAIFDTLTGSAKDLNFAGTIGSSSSRFLAEQYGALAIDFQGGSSSIVNVASSVTAYFQSNGDSAVAGGIVSNITSGYIRECTNYGRLDVYCPGNGADVGGIAGIGVSGTISDCKNVSGAVVYADCKTARVGGILGQRKRPGGTSIYASTQDIATTMNEGNAQANKQDGYTVNTGDIFGYDAAFDLDSSTLGDEDKNAKAKLDPYYTSVNTGYFYVSYIRTEQVLWIKRSYYAAAWEPYQNGSLSTDTGTYLNSKDYKQA